MVAYYNEFDPFAAQWLRNLIAAGHIAPGDVDERSITDVQPDDLNGYTQCHFFAGIGGWSYAARLAGWPDDRPLWTGSPPCQPWSVAGKGEGKADPRDLWPTFFKLISAQRPDVVMGEQVAAAVGKHWLDRTADDMEGVGYAFGAAIVPACAVDAPHRRDRLWFVADAKRSRSFSTTHAGIHRSQESRRARDVEPIRHCALGNGVMAHADTSIRRPNRTAWNVSDRTQAGWEQGASYAFAGSSWFVGSDGKARRFEPSIRMLADGASNRVGRLSAYGNAIVPQVAAEIIGAYLDAEADRSVRVGAS